MVIDPENPEILYIGNDLGVWVSMNEGQSWAPYGDGAPQAMLVMHLSVIPQTRKLRVATHGLGMWQVNMADPSGITSPTGTIAGLKVFPNPARDRITVAYALGKPDEVAIRVCDFSGMLIHQTPFLRESGGRHTVNLELFNILSGTYSIQLTSRKAGVLQRASLAVVK